MDILGRDAIRYSMPNWVTSEPSGRTRIALKWCKQRNDGRLHSLDLRSNREFSICKALHSPKYLVITKFVILKLHDFKDLEFEFFGKVIQIGVDHCPYCPINCGSPLSGILGILEFL